MSTTSRPSSRGSARSRRLASACSGRVTAERAQDRDAWQHPAAIAARRHSSVSLSSLSGRARRSAHARLLPAGSRSSASASRGRRRRGRARAQPPAQRAAPPSAATMSGRAPVASQRARSRAASRSARSPSATMTTCRMAGARVRLDRLHRAAGRRRRLDSLRRYEPDQVPRVCGALRRTLSARGRSPVPW